MNAANNITYPYGETPESVIRLRFQMYEKAGRNNRHSLISKYAHLEDLLTVLDALRVSAAQQLVWGDERHPEVGEDRERRQSARQLRISILAALGVDES